MAEIVSTARLHQLMSLSTGLNFKGRGMVSAIEHLSYQEFTHAQGLETIRAKAEAKIHELPDLVGGKVYVADHSFLTLEKDNGVYVVCTLMLELYK